MRPVHIAGGAKENNYYRYGLIGYFDILNQLKRDVELSLDHKVLSSL